MNEVELVERRRAQLRQAIEQWFGGNESAYAKAVKRQPSQISDMLAGRKSFGAKVARMMETELAKAGLSVPPFWFEAPGADLAIPATVQLNRPPDADPDVVEIPQLNVSASMGSGITVPQHEDVVAVLQVHESGLRAQLGNTPVTSFKNLRLITAYGDSMAPTFQGGDVLLVDTGVYEVRLDAIYVMSYRGELFIKRLQRRPDGVLRMLSDNKNYDPIDIHNGQRDEFQALGRVLMAWNARKL